MVGPIVQCPLFRGSTVVQLYLMHDCMLVPTMTITYFGIQSSVVRYMYGMLFIKGITLDVQEYDQQDSMIEDLWITYIPFNASLGIFSINSTADLDSDSNNEATCMLMFVNKAGAVHLTTNTIR